MMPIVLEGSIEQLGCIIAVKPPALFVAFADDLELLLFEIDLLKVKCQNF